MILLCFWGTCDFALLVCGIGRFDTLQDGDIVLSDEQLESLISMYRNNAESLSLLQGEQSPPERTYAFPRRKLRYDNVDEDGNLLDNVDEGGNLLNDTTLMGQDGETQNAELLEKEHSESLHHGGFRVVLIMLHILYECRVLYCLFVIADVHVCVLTQGAFVPQS